MNYLSRMLIFFFVLLAACKPAQKSGNTTIKTVLSDSAQIKHIEASNFLRDLLHRYPQHFEDILHNPENRVQIIYTQIDRGKNNPDSYREAKFTDHYFNVKDDEYFYPASTVKLPIAVLALQKLNELNIAGLDMNTTMITEADYDGHTAVYNDPTSPDGRPAIAHYIKKILLVSDNDAFNRLYEFLGQEYINNTLHKMGYEDVQIVHRLDISMTEDQNRYANPVNFLDSNGKIIYAKPSGKANWFMHRGILKWERGFIEKVN